MPKYSFFFLLLNLLYGAKLGAQPGGCPEKFKAYNTKGLEVNTFCVGEKIRFKSCSSTAQPDKEYYDTNKTDGLAFPDTIKSVSYPLPGTYTVTQLINTGLPGNNQFERTFTVLPTPTPEIQIVACAFNKINVRITNSNYDSYFLQFGDGIERRVSPEKDTVYQYRQAGTYTITVKAAYRNASCVVENTMQVQTLAAAKAPELQSLQISRYAVSQGSLVLEVPNLQPEYTYVVERAPLGSATFQEMQLIAPVAGSSTFPLNNIDTRTVYQYRLQVTDACGTKTGVFSNVLVAQPINIATTEKALQLTWPAYPKPAEVHNYQIYRDTKLIQTLPANATSYLDVAVACGREYCYQVVVSLINNRFSRSNDTCKAVIATKAPSPGLALATFNPKNQVELKLQIAPNETVSEVNWQKSVNNSSFTSLAVDKKLTYLDSTLFSENTVPCYQATYTDSCGLTSVTSNKTCPVILRGMFQSSENSVQLSWSAFVGFKAAGRYTVEVTDDATGQLLASYPVGSQLTYTDNKLNTNSQLLAYRIKVTAANLPEVSYSNKVIIAQAFTAAIPTAFSPNNDGLNDIFEVKGRFINAVQLKIYNRWGQVIFESKNPNQGWDGKINGQEAPVGTYVYSFTAQDLNGNTINRKGSVTLIK